jgi:DNA helicase II / ATP-dependent DNA helicase PcrA
MSVTFLLGAGNMNPIKEKIWGAPGCGKTTSLMAKYKEFVEKGNTTEDITVTTYRKSSAQYFINSVAFNTGLPSNEISRHVGTFHSVCFHLLSEYNYRFVGDNDRKQFLKESGYAKYHKQSFEGDEEQGKSGSLFDFAGWMAETRTEDDKWRKYPSAGKMTLPDTKVTNFLDDWEDYKYKNRKIDFSDMPLIVLREKIPLDTSILMVDEFQDMTKLLYDTFVHLTHKCKHVVIAGDPNQSIYGYKGGSPEFFLQYDADETILNHSHRFPNPIWNLAKKVSSSNCMVKSKFFMHDKYSRF